MLYKLIVAYLIGIVVAANFLTDMSFILMSFIVSFMSFIIYKKYKGHFIFPKSLIFFAIIFTTFCIGILYTNTRDNAVSYRDYGQREYEMEGKIVEVKQRGTTKEVTMEIEHVRALDAQEQHSRFPKYIIVHVSLFNELSAFDRIDVVGEIEYENFSFRSEKLFYNTNYHVTQPRKIKRHNYDKTFYETGTLWFHNFCDSLMAKITEHMPEPFAGIAKGISLGNQDDLQKDVKDIFKTSGLIHILVLSGANVSFIILIFWHLLSQRKLNLRVYTKVVSSIIFAWAFILGTGLTPPSIRAGVMSSSNILGEYFSKNISTLQSLLLSLFVLTLINPLSLMYSPSLHLSFLACIGLFIITPILETRFKLNFLISSFVGLMLTTTPYILYMNGSTSVFGTLLTFLVEPFVAATTMLSFLIIASSFISNFAAEAFGFLNSLSTKFIFFIAQFGARHLPQIEFIISGPLLASYYLILAIIFYKLSCDIIREKE